MKRFAAHYIYLSSSEIYRQHCIELDENDVLVRIFPLDEEIEDTAFYNGILFPLALNEPFLAEKTLDSLYSLQAQYPEKAILDLLEMLEIAAPSKECPVAVYQLDGTSQLSLFRKV